MKQKGFKSQLPSNLITNIIYFALNLVIGLWIVPFYVLKLKVDGYGFIQMATQITFFATFVTLSLNSAVSRYLTIYIQRNDLDEANRTFNTAIVISTVIIMILLPLAFCLSYFADKIFTIPAGTVNVNDTKILFFIVFLSFMITVFSNPFTASTNSHNRIDLSNIINIINVVVRTLLVIILLKIFPPSLTSVGLSFLFASLASMAASYIVCRRISPELKINLKYFDKSKVGSLTMMGFWLIINQLGTILLVNFDLLLINWIFKDTAMQGKYAVLLNMAVLLRNLSFIISRATGPMVLISYAKNEINKLISIMKSSVKFMGILLAIPIGLLCGFADPFLHVWLGRHAGDYIPYIPLFWLMTAPLIINLGIQPLYTISTAYNKVKAPGLVTFIVGLAYVGIAYLLAHFTNLGLYSIALASMIVLTLKNGIFTTLYSAYVIKCNYFTFVKPVITGIIITLALFVCSYLFSQYIPIHSWFTLIAYSLIILLPFLPIIWIFIINNEEKETLKSIIVKVFDK